MKMLIVFEYGDFHAIAKAEGYLLRGLNSGKPMEAEEQFS